MARGDCQSRVERAVTAVRRVQPIDAFWACTRLSVSNDSHCGSTAASCAAVDGPYGITVVYLGAKSWAKRVVNLRDLNGSQASRSA